jgi:hypothetical protein
MFDSAIMGCRNHNATSIQRRMRTQLLSALPRTGVSLGGVAALIPAPTSSISRGMRRGMLIGLTLLCWTGGAHAVDVVEIRWGFDGRVLRHRFNVLSLLVNNPRAEAFDGELVLHKLLGPGQRVDAAVVEDVFVAPFGERWVQFYPYVGGDWAGEEWELEIRPAKGRRGPVVTINPPRMGWPARVLIETSTTPVRRTLPIRRLPDVLFPPFVTATDGLQAVLLDAAPRWDEPRRQAFLDWLYLGGTVYVLHTADGSYPEFPAALGLLNTPLEELEYGAGRVIRVPRSRFELSPASLTELFSALPKRLVVKITGFGEQQTVEASAVDLEADTDPAPRAFSADGADPLHASSFLTRLRGMTRPRHNWVVLHLLFWTYMALIFPGCYVLGRRWADYRLVYLAMLLVVAVFSLLFGYVGQRGYGESTKVHSVAIARFLPDGAVDVSQWSNAFVTQGGVYELRHSGTGALYSTCTLAEAVNGVIRNGAEARFEVDIPPFSSREFAHRVRVQAARPQFNVARCETDGEQLRALTIQVDERFPRNSEPVVVLYGRRFYALDRGNRELTLGAALGTATAYLLVQENLNFGSAFNPWFQPLDRPEIELFREMFTPLMARSLSVSRWGDAEALRLPSHVVRLFYFDQLPQELAVSSLRTGKNEGWVLYVADLPAKAAPP